MTKKVIEKKFDVIGAYILEMEKRLAKAINGLETKKLSEEYFSKKSKAQRGGIVNDTKSIASQIKASIEDKLNQHLRVRKKENNELRIIIRDNFLIVEDIISAQWIAAIQFNLLKSIHELSESILETILAWEKNGEVSETTRRILEEIKG